MKYMEIRDLIDSELKKYSHNQLIPSERYLAMKYHCSRETIRKAYEQLRAEDKIYKVQNVGWFVSNKKIQYYPTSTDNFNGYVSAQGFKIRTELISTHIVKDFEGIQHFDIAHQEQGFVEIVRLRYADDVPVLLSYNYLPLKLFPNILEHDIISSVQEVVMHQYNVPYTSSQLKIKNTAVAKEDLHHLGVPPNQTAIYIERISKSSDQVIEYDVEIWPQDKIEMNLDIQG
ncbi:GntR family transcriptional regulator [Acinetobacter shaoyimingii]|uniref:GntR family transcriptional regulator n=1 Tax=Acinetobacter shaoyimingii TaxID=2715164 RepID=A0A6G8RTH9_9GAMM|nr:GntR family transcriptional regulator [Acinetobacter shaoyimingii]NHB58852.1 GntR family transcriptional regulator [Acinetobacter shaoyimingii]QIO05242.1 GntR family transcriptional regulator [Acinetobacter shaoyimingii]